MEAAAAMATIQSQPHLSRHTYREWDDELEENQYYDDDDTGSSSSGELLQGGGGGGGLGVRSSSWLRRRSYGDFAGAGAGGGPRSSKPPPPRHGNEHDFHVWTTDEHAAEAYLHVSASPGYVSFEDVIGGTALYRDGSGRPLEAAISDPLLSTASRLCAREDRDGPQRHCRQPSPGPMGTCRGSAMHAIIKKYVHPLQGFLLGTVFRCFMPS